VWPREPRSQSCIVYLHGGAYVSGSPRSYRRLTSHLARAAGCQIIAVDYRLAPEHPYPATLDDSLAVYRGLLAEGRDAARLFIAGDSAGGGLTLATAVSLRDAGLPLLAGLLCIAPWTDLTGSGESMRTRNHRERMMTPSGMAIDARNYAGTESLTHPLISPIFADLAGLPPLMIQVGDDEVLLDDSTRIADAASRHDISVSLHVWPHLWHVWHLYAGLFPEATAAIQEMADFVAARSAHAG
jgi:epsilon-lactone hydrolase